MNELHVKCLLYADDQVILASSAKQLQDMVTLMNEAFKSKGMNINVNNTTVVEFGTDKDVSLCDVKINDVSMEQVNDFVYLGSMFTRNGKIDADVERRVNAGKKVDGGIHAVVTTSRCFKRPEWLFTMACWYVHM